jgi:NADPH:quinone reductase-like Zn-dependent oxidoreductase
MLAAAVRRYGPPEVVHLEEIETPAPGPGEIRVRVRTTTVGASDVAFRAGSPWFARLVTGLRRPRRPVLGTDFAGVVDAVGAGVTAFAVDDRVHGVTGVDGGTHAEYVIVAESGAGRRVPDGVDDVQAVAMLDGFLTALPFLRDVGRVTAGDRVLVNGASGAVGSAAVQLARWMGARVTAVTSTPNVELVRSLGAEHVIDYTRESFTDARDAYDLVFDAVGRSSFGRSRRSLTAHGVYATTVPSASVLLHIPLTRLLGRRRAALALTGLRSDAAKRADLALLPRLAADGAFAAVVDRVDPLADIVEAHRRAGTGHKVGSVVLAVHPCVPVPEGRGGHARSGRDAGRAAS